VILSTKNALAKSTEIMVGMVLSARFHSYREGQVFSAIQFANCKFLYGNLTACKFIGCTFYNCEFSCDFTNCVFDACSFAHVSFWHLSIMDTTFDYSTIRKSDFRYCTFIRVSGGSVSESEVGFSRFEQVNVNLDDTCKVVYTAINDPALEDF